MDLVTTSSAGLYCPAGDFYIDPIVPVPRAVLTHVHADHARRGSQRYLVAAPGRALAALRLGTETDILALAFGEQIHLGAATVSLHPSGHVLGSAQVRIAHRGQVCVVSGDYKLAPDPTCHSFEPVRCHTFITESTFGLPVYRWPDATVEMERLHRWWRNNQAQGCTSILLAYSLGKAQRLLALLDRTIGPVVVHPAIAAVNQAYADSGIRLPEVSVMDADGSRAIKGQGLFLAPPNAGPALKRRLRPCAVACASGWMAVRGQRRRQGVDAGFVISDHADWPGLLSAIEATEAEQIGVTHGYVQPLVRYLREQGYSAQALTTVWSSKGEEEG